VLITRGVEATSFDARFPDLSSAFVRSAGRAFGGRWRSAVPALRAFGWFCLQSLVGGTSPRPATGLGFRRQTLTEEPNPL